MKLTKVLGRQIRKNDLWPTDNGNAVVMRTVRDKSKVLLAASKSDPGIWFEIDPDQTYGILR